MESRSVFFNFMAHISFRQACSKALEFQQPWKPEYATENTTEFPQKLDEEGKSLKISGKSRLVKYYNLI